MANKFSRNTMKISQIYNSFKEESLIVDSSYQRKKVWIAKDNVRLIETILLDLVIPEIFIWDYDTDPETGKTITHIVDGQQRINAIFDFISGKYKLLNKYLLDDTIKGKYSNKSFSELDDESKKAIWSYEMSIVNLDKHFSKDDVRNMFYRLNLTDYNLNEQEKRNSLDSEFGKIAESLADNNFWAEYKIFSPNDIRRMKDIEYCGNILLLVREGILDQTKGDRLDQIYKELGEEYADANIDLEKVYKAITLIKKLTNNSTNGFLNKKIQMYTLFCVIFDFLDNDVHITDEMVNKFYAFMDCYIIFKNEYELELSQEEQKVAEILKRYKLASSEGVNKLNNRILRFEILKKILLENSICTETFSKFSKLMSNIKE